MLSVTAIVWTLLLGAILFLALEPSQPIPLRVDSRGVPQSIHGPSPPAPMDAPCFACHTVHEDRPR